LRLILFGSGIVTNNIANKGCQYFDYGLMLSHSPWIAQDTRPRMVDAPWRLIEGGSDIITNNIPNKSGQYFDYGLMLLHTPCIMQDARP